MIWTTVCDLPFLNYQPNLAIDTSDFKNNAQILGNVLTHNKYVTLKNPDDQLVIPVKDDSLQRFTALKIEAIINPTSIPHRLNIVEGWMSFAFFIESNQKLTATIYDGKNWVQITSIATLVPLNQWSRVSFSYDGVCIGRLTIDSKTIGTNINMPLGMRQPQQNITIGHWPSGDSRYTFIGDIGHVRIDRRDYEDFWKGAVLNLFCNRHLDARQADALKELLALMDLIDPKAKEALRKCVKERSDKLLELFRTLRAGNMQNIATQKQLGNALRNAWCCKLNIPKAKQTLLDLLKRMAGPPDSRARKQFKKTLEEFLKLSSMCQKKGYPYDRMRELIIIALPELSLLQIEVEQLIQNI